MENKELVQVQEKVKGMKKVVEDTIILSDEDLQGVSDKIKNIKTLGKFIKQKKEAFTAPAKEIIEQAKEMFDGPIKECTNAEELLKQKAAKYLTAKEEARVKAQTKIEKDLESGKIKKVETAVSKLEALPEQQKSVKTESSSLRMVKRKVAEIVDPSLVPDKYWIINEVLLKKETLELDKMGFPPVAGTIIKEVSSMASV